MKVIQTSNETHIFLTAVMIKFGNKLPPEVMDFATLDIWNICSCEKFKFW